jgi:hypothetical protein
MFPVPPFPLFAQVPCSRFPAHLPKAGSAVPLFTGYRLLATGYPASPEATQGCAGYYPCLCGQEPLAQEFAWAQPAGWLAEPAWAAKVENALSVLPDPHFSHLCGPFAPAFSRKPVTCPH